MTCSSPPLAAADDQSASILSVRAHTADICRVLDEFYQAPLPDFYGQKSCEVWSTGHWFFNAALRMGGIPKGSVIEVFGEPASGKTSLSYALIAEVQRQGGVVALANAEYAFDAHYAQQWGVQLQELVLIEAESEQQEYEVLLSLVRTGQIDFVVVDTLSALSLYGERCSDDFSPTYGDITTELRMFLSQVAELSSSYYTTFLFLTQLRAFWQGEQNYWVTTGRSSLAEYAQLRFQLFATECSASSLPVAACPLHLKIFKHPHFSISASGSLSFVFPLRPSACGHCSYTYWLTHSQTGRHLLVAFYLFFIHLPSAPFAVLLSPRPTAFRFLRHLLSRSW